MSTRSGQSYSTPSNEDSIPKTSTPPSAPIIMATITTTKPKTRAAIDFPTITIPANEDTATAILAIN
eukprot:7778373-Pyramimonas_sp.AAC.1